MNLPNRLTLLRVLMIPLYLALAALGRPALRPLAAGVFALACLTDFLDGYLARRQGLITTFGIFLDPIADKLLVVCALVWLTAEQTVSPWLTLVVIAREFVVSGLRLVAASKGLVLAAGSLGKAKTVCQMILVIALTLGLQNLRVPLSWLVAVLTIWSGAAYVWANRNVIWEEETT